MATRLRPHTSAPGDGSRTITILNSQPIEEDSSRGAGGSSQPPGVATEPEVLRLRGGPRSAPRVIWSEEVVDNEGCGRKKSKICCIYHKPRRFDESSDESSSDESDSDEHRAENHHHHHHHDNEATRGPGSLSGSDAGPNAYESLPKTQADFSKPRPGGKKGPQGSQE